LPECTEFDAPDRDSSRDWVREDQHITRSPPGATTRASEAQGGEHRGGVESARRRGTDEWCSSRCEGLKATSSSATGRAG
jgi:hypothetical protein